MPLKWLMALCAAWRYPALYKRVDWRDRREGPMANAGADYPELDRAVFEPGDLVAAVTRMNSLRPESGRRSSKN